MLSTKKTKRVPFLSGDVYIKDSLLLSNVPALRQGGEVCAPQIVAISNIITSMAENALIALLACISFSRQSEEALSSQHSCVLHLICRGDPGSCKSFKRSSAKGEKVLEGKD